VIGSAAFEPVGQQLVVRDRDGEGSWPTQLWSHGKYEDRAERQLECVRDVLGEVVGGGQG
jgi:hypothetical protein